MTFVPTALVETLPPSMQLLLAPMSTGKYKPELRAASCASCNVTPASAVKVRADLSSSSMRFIRASDKTMSPLSVAQPCTRFVVPPNGTTVCLFWLQNAKTVDTCSVEAGNTAAVARQSSCVDQGNS